MRTYQVLETEKYFIEANKHAVNRVRNRNAMHNLMVFLFGIGLMAATYYAVREMPRWLPDLLEFIEIISIRWF